MRNFFRSHPYIPIYTTFFLDNFGLVIVLPIFSPLLLHPEFGFFSYEVPLFTRLWVLGLLTASFPFAQFFGAPIIGEFSDRFGRKIAFIFSISCSAIGYFLTALGVVFLNLPLLFFSRLLTGFAEANRTICLAALADIYGEEEERRKRFGSLAAIEGVSFVASILVGGSFSNPHLSRFFFPSLPFWITAIFTLCNLFVILFAFSETKTKKTVDKFDFFLGVRNLYHALKTRHAVVVYSIYFFIVLCWMTELQFNSAFLIEKFHASKEKITYTYTLVGVFWATGSGLANRYLSEKYTPKYLLLISLFFMFFVMFLQIFTPSYFTYLTLFCLASLSLAVAWPTSLAMVSLLTKKEIQGKLQGMNQSTGSLALILGPILMGYFLFFDVNDLHIFTSSSAFIGFLILLIFYHKREKKKDGLH